MPKAGKIVSMKPYEMKDKSVLKLSLLENAFDFLNCSLEFVVRARNQGSQREWKFAILNIVHAIELLLKERLRREHELLIYANIDKYKPLTRQTPTVTWQVLIERIKYVLGDDLEKIDSGRIDRARELRNQMVHYDIEMHFPEIYHEYANLWNFVREFTEKVLGENLIERIDKELQIEYEDLGTLFYEEIVYYNSGFMAKEHKDEILKEQLNTHITIGGIEYQRIKYGDPQEYADFELDTTPYFARPCGDCLVSKGQVHLLGCDIERCPKCGEQLLSPHKCVDVQTEGVVHPPRNSNT